MRALYIILGIIGFIFVALLVRYLLCKSKQEYDKKQLGAPISLFGIEIQNTQLPITVECPACEFFQLEMPKCFIKYA